MSKLPPPAPTASAIGPCPTIIQIVGRPGTGSFTQHHRTTRPTLLSLSLRNRYVIYSTVFQYKNPHACRLGGILVVRPHTIKYQDQTIMFQGSLILEHTMFLLFITFTVLYQQRKVPPSPWKILFFLVIVAPL